MKKLVKPATPPDFIEYLIGIRDAKLVSPGGVDHKAVLASKHNEIVLCFNAFETSVEEDSIHQLTPSRALNVAADSLRSCYSVRTAGIKRVKQVIKDAQPQRVLKYCPLCGTTLPRTHDHYLPTSTFPELSVHALNLVPCCAQCNSIKDNDWLDAAGKRQYLHFFSDYIPAGNFLVVTLKELPRSRGVGALFHLKRPDDVPQRSWELIESHYRRLHLLERYTEQVNDEIAEILADCVIYLEEGGTNASSFLNRRATERAAVYGTSHWLVVLMRALSESPRLSVWLSAIASSRTLAQSNGV
jgi:hypothetical protein